MVTQIKKIKEDDENLRILPMNLEAEQALLASLLTDNKTYEKVSDFLKHNHFYDDISRRIFEGISKLIENNQLADPLTLKNYFLQKNELDVIANPKRSTNYGFSDKFDLIKEIKFNKELVLYVKKALIQ